MNKASAFDMDALDSRIRELVAYARERDGEDRTTLFRNLVDLFLTGKAPTKEPTRSQLLDVLEALIPHVEADSRRTVADLVASMSKPPLDLAVRLCRDRASLVGNLLKEAAFDEDDILDLIDYTGREHHQILASRDDLSANVWIALARAAPNAPAINNQSTLALWSDDLGITCTKQEDVGITQTQQVVNGSPTATITTLRADKPMEPSPSKPRARAIGKPSKTGKPSIRIIKTDEDLIAERLADLAETATTEKEPPKETVKAPAVTQPESTRSSGEPALDPALQQFVAEETPTATDVKDPGPGGWAWRSDRDGIVSSISPMGITLLGDGIENSGTTVLDILGLNHKLGHPVARAFQRRSTIHDAPIFLTSLEEGSQHWTLEATPFFSSCGGIFEGYEGILTPVSAGAAEEDQLLPSEEEASAIFLDEVTDRINTPVKTALAKAPEEAETTPVKTAEEQPVQKPAPAQKKQPAPAAPKASPTKNSNDDLTNLASSALQEVIGETLKPLTAALEAKAAPASQPQPASRNSEALSALDLLEEALARLAVSGKNSGDIQVRLQSEIAAACARTLRDILSE